ncbi:MAG: class I SAM-dependent methyltransferase [Salibacteraceae bacterium]
MSDKYLEINKESWNKRTDVHFESEFYDNKTFIEGRNSLNDIELPLLSEIKGKSVLHLQCHFGQDTISLSRMGADAIGIDLSDQAILKAKELAITCGVSTRFLESDVYDLSNRLNEKFDVVFTTYGTIAWLPDIDRWAAVVNHFLKPGGKLVFADFHPVVWMFDDDFNEVKYRYFNDKAIEETEEGTYTNPEAELNENYVSWNHGIGEVVTALRNQGLLISDLSEFDYSPYNCFKGTIEFSPGKFRIEKMGNNIPMVYRLEVQKPI